MKFVIAPDSFKNGMTAKQAANAIKTGLKRIFPEATYTLVPMADGGEGTVQSLVDATKGRLLTAEVTGPLGKPVNATYGILGDQYTGVIEMSQASGIQYVTKTTRNPLKATTFGTGELILKALDQGVNRLIIGIGGSATNDGGAGMAQALGAELLDDSGQAIQLGGGNLNQLKQIRVTQIDPRIKKTEIIIASDVTNPLIGKQGASAVFGPQKGATPEMVQLLDQNLTHYAKVLQRDLGLDLANRPGAGAAGGLGAGLVAFTNATMKKGIDIVIEYSGLKNKAQNADYVFTGEGGIDFQTKYGKTPYGVALTTKAVAPDAPVIVIAGNVGKGIDELYADNAIDAIFTSVSGVKSLREALATGPHDVAQVAENIARLIKKGIGSVK
ncbi:glycerate kinase [Pediococcus acidilactici]|uniref:glycerate kinase family protein n=1 Tax=Pediococcus acidilactici TaxID=1254 RepID=UPI000463A358|nr:glycerate kinase [Pediococcus acidilactici]KAF0495633.1 glycerate kinase [Pediococcus acidilactici]MCF4061312.1 glycerate kinase [Pediococcus acidilactici]MCJ2191674.1 glycerate kinase [Pediococcus acidilactici]MWB53334.1 glycerate kinase [Pediococcus acidilactici]QAR71044.1 glycerate kinase [Pediococcus acidilactici]